MPALPPTSLAPLLLIGGSGAAVAGAGLAALARPARAAATADGAEPPPSDTAHPDEWTLFTASTFVVAGAGAALTAWLAPRAAPTAAGAAAAAPALAGLRALASAPYARTRSQLHARLGRAAPVRRRRGGWPCSRRAQAAKKRAPPPPPKPSPRPECDDTVSAAHTNQK